MNTTDSPWIRTVSLPLPTLQDNTADADRLINALKSQLKTTAIDVDVELLRRLPSVLRNGDYKIRCIVLKDRQKWILMGLSKLDDTSTVAGLAVDLGTTRVVLRLLDLETGRTIAESAFDNPQESVGPDVLARIHFADQPGGLEKLNELIINGLNQAIGNICTENGLELQNIYALSLAGNTTMTHLFMGLSIPARPYPSVCCRIYLSSGIKH
jgi:uncharacterized 2Fe-2S/4Fe-4S cluster protein (DUF4445 family)